MTISVTSDQTLRKYWLASMVSRLFSTYTNPSCFQKPLLHVAVISGIYIDQFVHVARPRLLVQVSGAKRVACSLDHEARLMYSELPVEQHTTVSPQSLAY